MAQGFKLACPTATSEYLDVCYKAHNLLKMWILWDLVSMAQLVAVELPGEARRGRRVICEVGYWKESRGEKAQRGG